MKIIIKCDDPQRLDQCLNVARECIRERQPSWSDVVGFRRGDHFYSAHFLKSGTITIRHEGELPF